MINVEVVIPVIMDSGGIETEVKRVIRDRGWLFYKYSGFSRRP